MDRVASLDALRGFDMFWIIGGDEIYKALAKATDSGFLKALLPQFEHTWSRFGFYDLIMPLFLFVVGAVMPFSFAKRLAKDNGKRKLYLHIVARAVILFFLGMAASGNLLDYDLSKLHIYYNALQSIAVGYFIASIIMLNMKLPWQIATTAALLLLYWVLMTFVPVPGYGAGVFTEQGNLAVYIDKLILGRFQQGVSWTYVLGSMNFVSLVMLGIFAGYILRSGTSKRTKLLRLVAVGATCTILGKVWNIWFPINNHLRTSSMVLFGGGLSYLLLALFYLLIDIRGFKRWAFGFIVIGSNALAVYMAVELFDFRLVADVFVGGLTKWLGPWNDFARWTGSVTILWLIMYWMYKKKSFIKI